MILLKLNYSYFIGIFTMVDSVLASLKDDFASIETYIGEQVRKMIEKKTRHIQDKIEEQLKIIHIKDKIINTKSKIHEKTKQEKFDLTKKIEKKSLKT